MTKEIPLVLLSGEPVNLSRLVQVDHRWCNSSLDLLVADERGAVDLLDQRVVVAADPPAHSALALWTGVVMTVLHHEVHRSAGVEIHAQVLKVLQHVRVLDEERRDLHEDRHAHQGTCANMQRYIWKIQ